MVVSLFVFVVFCVDRGLCNELITRSEVSYRICTFAGVCIFVCGLRISITRLPGAGLGCMATENALYSAIEISPYSV
jgi:hypothetical protein